MAHVRQLLREAAREILIGYSRASTRVYLGQSRPVERGKDISIFIYTPSEQTTDQSMDGLQERRIRLRIDTIGRGDDEAAINALDDLAVFIETQIAENPDFDGVAHASSYRGVDVISNSEGEKPFHVMSHSVDVTIYTIKTNPEKTL